jgi:hypothetical protein
MLNFLFIGMLFIGVLYMTYVVVVGREQRGCPKVKYEYRPYTKTFTEEQENPVSPMAMYKGMFYNVDPLLIAQGDKSKEIMIQPFVHGGLPQSDIVREGESQNFLNRPR